MISENDPAGMGIAFCRAINNHSEHSCRLITRSLRYNFDFEKDIHVEDFWNDDVRDESKVDEVRQILEDADIVHFHILLDETATLGPLTIKDHVAGKTIVHHHHGHPEFRSDPMKWQRKYSDLRRMFLVSTPDLKAMAPEGYWVPNLVPLDDPDYAFMPDAQLPRDRMIVFQSPTRLDLKNTAELDEMLSKLALKYPIASDIVQNTNHRECLRRRRNAHVSFDHLQGYYGVSSLEALSQGKPLIAGLDSWNQRMIKEFTGVDTLPWIVCHSIEKVAGELLALCHSPETRAVKGVEGRRFMEKCWSEKHVIDRLFGFYERASAL
ncbi:MAG: glycosyltransferase family 1 protein [Planctomycetes bacterium]|nr:glycosyltransferase family 1 protein [Planctomycetota bacterium]